MQRPPLFRRHRIATLLLETVEALVALESPSTDKAAVDRCGVELSRRLAGDRRARRAATADRRAAITCAREFGGAGPPIMLMLGHFDTVWSVGQLERMPFREEDGRLHGPGIFDMKAGIAVAMLAVRAVRDAGADAAARS